MSKNIQQKKSKPIGVFDSGLGGLSVLKHFIKKLPNYNYIYLGDNGRVPYGNKSPELIYQYTREALDFLFGQGCQLVIVACNTASSQALRKIQQEYLPKKYPNHRVLGVIRPLAEEVAKNKNKQKIGIIGTSATINSQAYIQEIKHLQNGHQIYQQASPLLVPLIEEGWARENETISILKKYLLPLKKKKIATLIMGCTHYPILRKEIQKIMGPNCLVPDTGAIIASSLKKYLKKHTELEIKETAKPQLKFFVSDDPDRFKNNGEKFLGQKIKEVKKITL